MKKKKRNPKATAKDYSKFCGSFAGHTVADTTTPEYYGLMKKDGRVKIALKRMKKVKISGVPEEVLNAASQIPRMFMFENKQDLASLRGTRLLVKANKNGLEFSFENE